MNTDEPMIWWKIVPHELELSIGWNKTDASFSFELAELHTLMEGAVVYRDSSIFPEFHGMFELTCLENKF